MPKERFSLQWLKFMSQNFTESQLTELVEAAKEAAVHRVCSDACGICEHHFHQLPYRSINDGAQRK